MMRCATHRQVYRSFSSFACIHGNALKETTYKHVPEQMKQVSLLFTDPPYFILQKRRKKGDLRQDKTSMKQVHSSKSHHSNNLAVTPKFDSLQEYESFTHDYLTASLQILNHDATIAIWTNPTGRQAILSAAKQLGFVTVLNELRWIKPQQQESESCFPVHIDQFQSQSTKTEIVYHCNESVLILSRQTNESFQNTKRMNVIHPMMNDEIHPYAKPFDLLQPIIEQYTSPGDVILDTFAGSGSIGCAALKCSRRSVNIEMNTEWLHNCFRSLQSVRT